MVSTEMNVVGALKEGDGGTEEKRVTLDEAMEISGSLKRIQLFYQVFFLYVIFFTFYQSLLSVFAGDNPPWRCTKTSSLFCRQNIDLDIDITNTNFSKRCEMNREEWMYTTPKTYSYVTEFDLVCHRNYVSALIGGSFFIGNIVGALICGTISDVYGRKKVYALSLFFALASSLATSYANSVWMLLAFKFSIGSSCSAGFAFSATYLAELIPPKMRPMCINGSNLAFPLASLFLCGVAYLVPYWRRLQLFLSLPVILPLGLCVFIPESPYWLVSVGRHGEAVTIVRTIAHRNGKKFGEEMKLRRDDPSADTGKKYTYFDLFKQVKKKYFYSRFTKIVVIFNKCMGVRICIF